MDIFSFKYESAKRAVLRILLDGSAHKMYVEAWRGVGATALLREVAEEVEARGKRKFETVIQVVLPAPFRNGREMQRAVAEQLNLLLPLPPSVTAAAFDAADEDDDFSGVEFSSRDPLSEVAEEINRAVRDRNSVLLVLCNNIAGGKLIDANGLGIPIDRQGSQNAVLWTSGMNISREGASASADLIVKIEPPNKAAALDLVYKEAVRIARYIDESSGGRLRTTPLIVLHCFWYCLLLLRRAAFNPSALLLPDGGRPLEAAVKYFVCDGILQGDDAAAWEIGKALAPVIGSIVNDQYWQEEVTSSTWTPRLSELRLPPKTLLIDSITQGDWVKSLSLETKSYRWISICSPQNNNPEPWDFLSKLYGSSVMSDVSSFSGHFEKTLEALPYDFFDHFSNVRVLDLLGCIVSPIGHSSFLRLCNLRMLRLERCEVTSLDPNSHSSAPEGRQEPILFDNLWVLNLYNSDAGAFLLAGKAFELMPNLLELDLKEGTSLLHQIALNELREHMHRLEVLKLSGNVSTNFLPRSLSMAISLKELILNDCNGLEYLNFNLPATIETISLQRCASLKEVELVDPTATPLPNLKTFRLSGSKLIAKLSPQGCRKLENVDLQELTGLEVLDLSCTTIKAVDISKLPQLKQLFLLGCEQLRRVAGLDKGPRLDVLYLDNYNGGGACDVDPCLDSFQNQRQSELTKETNDADQRSFHAHVVVKDVRLFRSLRDAFPDSSRAKSRFHIHVKGSSTAKRGTNIGTTTRSNATITSASCYADVLNTMIDRHRRHHPSPPAMHLNNHIEVDGGHDSRIVEEIGFTSIMVFANSLFIRGNTSNFTISIPFRDLRCLRIKRCPNMEFIFSWGMSIIICWNQRAYGSANFRGSKLYVEKEGLSN
uniref:Uncharacterized protein n=1 Tax=Ananas comosus var. bracteatus TaxID=296719 RepID=A0A6V7NIH8_ANACO|nr:unnamed protein product [Ananas comosus var. bracteatus]